MRHLLTILFSFLGATFLASCQLPSSVSKASSSSLTDVAKITLTPSIAGLEEPTWGMPIAPVLTEGWGMPIDDTYTHIRTSKKVIAITFDDGPHPENTPRLLDMLKARNIKATFYVVGDMVTHYPEIVAREVAEGHEVGNHTKSHKLLSRLSDDGVRAELQVCHDAVIAASGVAPKTMRPPYGGITKSQKAWVKEEFGYPSILWSVDPLDWRRPGSSAVASRLLAGASPGGILLCHDIHPGTIDAMPAVLDQLLAQGYEFVTVAELIAMDESASESEQKTEPKTDVKTETNPATESDSPPSPQPRPTIMDSNGSGSLTVPVAP